MKKRGVLLCCAGLVVALGVGAVVWWNWFRAPYSLADSPGSM